MPPSSSPRLPGNAAIVLWYRNVFSHVPSTRVREGEDIVAARDKAVRVIENLAALRLTRAAELVGATVEETLTYYAFPEEHWRRIRTNNPLEDGARVAGAFPDGQSALNLAAARLRHIAGTAWSTKRYLKHRAAEGPADERCHLRPIEVCTAVRSRSSLSSALEGRRMQLNRFDCICHILLRL